LQEARAASALNHPNIVSVYDVGGVGHLSFIVTELIDGESLRNLIQHGRLTTRKLIDVAVQIADGLAAAHKAGVVHRDLKPENIMVTGDGRVKIVDFGIAKLITPNTLDASATTVSLEPVTKPGELLGTVNYMSPEQARGQHDLDGRSDQFSFGAVLYELVSGTPAFDRPTAVRTMAAIMHEEAPPLPPTVPVPFRWTIERCLAKEPLERYDTTHDLFLELRHLREHATEISPSPQIPPANDGSDGSQNAATAWIWLALAALVLAVGVYLGVRGLTSSPPSFERLTYRRGDVSGARFSPDGQTVWLWRTLSDIPRLRSIYGASRGGVCWIFTPWVIARKGQRSFDKRAELICLTRLKALSISSQASPITEPRQGQAGLRAR